MGAVEKNSPLTIATLLVGAGLLLTAVALFQTLLPLRAGIEQFSPALVGYLGTIYATGFVFGCVFGPALVKTVGHIRTFSGVVAIAAAASPHPRTSALPDTCCPFFICPDKTLSRPPPFLSTMVSGYTSCAPTHNISW